MPPITSPATSLAIRKAARRTRQAKPRARRSAQTTGPVVRLNRRAPKRRMLRDQESLNLDDCFYQCQESGYHLDPDVRVGRGTAANGMKVLEVVNDFSLPGCQTENKYSLLN